MAEPVLRAWKIPETENAYLIYVFDPAIPKGVKAFFRRETNWHTQAKMRIKDPENRMGERDWAEVRSLMERVAMKFNYQFDEMLKKSIGAPRW